MNKKYAFDKNTTNIQEKNTDNGCKHNYELLEKKPLYNSYHGKQEGFLVTYKCKECKGMIRGEVDK